MVSANQDTKNMNNFAADILLLAECVPRNFKIDFYEIISILDTDTLDISSLPSLVQEHYSIREKWYDIGLQLPGIEQSNLETIKADHRSSNSRFRALLELWLQQINPKPSRAALAKALSSASIKNHVVGIADENSLMEVCVLGLGMIFFAIFSAVVILALTFNMSVSDVLYILRRWLGIV